MSRKFILAIDAGTTGITIVLIDGSGKILHQEYSEFTQHFPKPGWVEHDANEIWKITLKLVQSAFTKYPAKNCSGIGITNQRETTVLWNKHNGKPIYNAIVWQCRRTRDYCRELISGGKSDFIRKKTGLVVDSYFSGPKIRWLLENVPDADNSLHRGEILFGTVDSWLIWKLTGGMVHATDHTNASRTMLYNIHNLRWDMDLVDLMQIPPEILPEVRSSMSNYGRTKFNLFGTSIPICGVAGDQQAALFGQMGFQPGDLKTTYGTGCFFLMNCGKSEITSSGGLLTTLACNNSGEPVYALEGSVFAGGSVIQWLRDELHLIRTAEESETLASNTNDPDDVLFIPAFNGLGAPYWRSDIKGAILGIHRGTEVKHIVRAALESIAFQVNDLVEAANHDLSEPVKSMYVDGGAAKNNLLMQLQSDLLNIPVIRPEQIESTSLGAGFLAGLSSGFWSSADELQKYRKIDRIFKPLMSEIQRNNKLQKWKNGVKMLLRT